MNFLDALHTYLPTATTYGEYGAGDSTIKASQYTNLKEIHSVESDKKWIEEIQSKIGTGSGHGLRPIFHHKEMGTAYKSWGHPGPSATETQKRAYSDPIPSKAPIDVLLIDGRFRVACALKAHGWLSESATVIFDDFWIRPHYHIVLDFYQEVQRMGTAAILKRKHGVSVEQERIRYYELIED